MAKIELRVADHNYRVGRLSALQQFHVGRRLAPVLAVMGVRAARVAADMARGVPPGGAEGAEGEELERLAEDAELAMVFMPVLPAMADVISKMSDEEANYIIFECLGVVEREVTDGRWQVTCTQKQLMFQDDMDMGVLIRLVAAVVQENLSGFLKGLGVEVPSLSS